MIRPMYTRGGNDLYLNDTLARESWEEVVGRLE